MDNIMVSEADDETKIIANILKHLSAEELREARLVSKGFNHIICRHPELLWAKNRLLLATQDDPDNDNEALLEKWQEIPLLDLILKHSCPNFHIYEADLLSDEARTFFGGSVRGKIKHLKLTDCECTSEVLLHNLACVSRSLEHLEILGFANFRHKMKKLFPPSRTPPIFNYLRTVVLQTRAKENQDDHFCYQSPDLPVIFLNCIFSSARWIERITLEGWSTRTCQNFFQVLSSMRPEDTKNLQFLEVLCITEIGLDAVEQFSFIRSLELTELWCLRKLSIRFSDALENVPGITSELVEELTKCMGRFLARMADSLEVLELLHCPVSNAIFQSPITTFSNLHRVTVEGSYVTGLDEDGNPIYDISRRYNRRRPPPSIRKSKTTGHVRKISTPSAFQATSESSSDPADPARIEVYKFGCAVLLVFICIHLVLQWIFGNLPKIGLHFEVIIFASIAAFMKLKPEIASVVSRWQSYHHRD